MMRGLKSEINLFKNHIGDPTMMVCGYIYIYMMNLLKVLHTTLIVRGYTMGEFNVTKVTILHWWFESAKSDVVHGHISFVAMGLRIG